MPNEATEITDKIAENKPKEIVILDKELAEIGLNSQQMMFVYYYCDPSINFVGYKAALATSGIQDHQYTPAQKAQATKMARNLLESISVRKGIDLLRKHRLKNLEDIAQNALMQVSAMATINPTEIMDITMVQSQKDIPPILHTCIKNITPKYKTNMETGEQEFLGYSLTFYDKQKAMELLTKLLGMQQTILKHEIGDDYASLLKEINSNKPPDIVQNGDDIKEEVIAYDALVDEITETEPHGDISEFMKKDNT